MLVAPARPLHVTPKGGRGLCLRNPDIETTAANVWNLVQSDQQNLATQIGQLSRLVCGHDTDTLTAIRAPRRFCTIDQMNFENSLQQI